MLIGWAFRKSISSYNITTLKHDLVASLIISFIALPLAMALSIAVGLPPQYGLYTAIIAGTVVPLLGGSFHQVSGPTAAFVVIIAPIIRAHGLRGLIITTLIAGIILILIGVLKLGRYINYIPYPVTTGFTAGIAVVIAILSLNDFLGLHIAKMPESFLHKANAIIQALPHISWSEAAVGSLSLLLMFMSKCFIKNIPSQIIGIIAGTILSIVLLYFGFNVDTIGSRFSYTFPDGTAGHGVPPFLPTFNILGLSKSELFALPSISELKVLLIPSCVIAALAALESLLSAAVADGMANTKHNPNAELVGIGIGNILSGLASGIPATGAIARTATNIQGGGKTPIASALHGVLILFYILFFARYIAYIPMATLAALLLFTAYCMSHIKQCIRVLKIGPAESSIVLIVCFGFTVAIDMIAGVTVGIITACFLLLKRLAGITQLQVSSHKNKKQKTALLHIPRDVAVYHISGSLFFGNIEEIVEQIEIFSTKIKTFIVDLEEVPFIDMSGMIAIKRIAFALAKEKKILIVCAKRTIAVKIKEKLRDIPQHVYIEENLKKSLAKASQL